MSSDTDLFNRALARIGEARVVSIDDTNPRGQALRDIWPSVRQSALRSHPWNFSIRRAVLAPESTAPAFKWANRFRKPAAGSDHAGWLRTLGVWEDANENVAAKYKEEGRYLLADRDTLYLVFIADITDPNAMDALFREGLMLKLAAELAIPLTNSAGLYDRLNNEAMTAWARAKAVDGLGDPQEFQREDTWLRSRRSWGGRRNDRYVEVP